MKAARSRLADVPGLRQTDHNGLRALTFEGRMGVSNVAVGAAKQERAADHEHE